MSAPIENLLSHLEGVQQRGVGKWFARCPAHDDGRPSLSVQETSEGTVLLHCFAGCGAGDICAAVGLSLANLFVQRPPDEEGRRHKRHRPAFSPKDVIRLLDHERLVIMALAGDMQHGYIPTADDIARMVDAGRKIDRLWEIVS